MRRVIETRHEVDERGFAGAGGTDERHGFALLGGKVDAFEHGFARIRVSEAHVAEFDFALLARFAGVAAGAVGDQRFGVEHFEHALCGHVRSRPQHEHHAHQQEAHDHLHGVAGEHHHVGEGGELVGRVGGVDQVGADPVHGKHKTVHDGVHQRHHEGHGTVGEQLGVGEFLVGLGELGFLVILGIVGAHHAQAGEVLARHKVDVIGQSLHGLELRHDENHEDRNGDQQHHYRDAGGERPFETVSRNLADGPNRHNRRFDNHHQSHGDEHLNLRNIVRGTRNQRGCGESAHFSRSERFYLAEFHGTQTLAERCADACHEIAGDDGACCRSKRNKQHFAAGDPNIVHLAAGGFHEGGDVGHVVRQGQVKPDLPDDADQCDEHLAYLRFGEVSHNAEHAWIPSLVLRLKFLRLMDWLDQLHELIELRLMIYISPIELSYDI